MTGSVNQFGQAQAIGGVNEKIEGFFEICQARGLTGEQAVLIPEANVKNLMVRQEVREAVAAGLFQIYAVTNVDQAMELLTGMPMGERNAQGEFPATSLQYRVEAYLQALSKTRRAYAGLGSNKQQTKHTD